MNREYLKMALLAGATALLCVAGKFSESRNVAHDDKNVHFLLQKHLVAQPLTTTVRTPPVYVDFSTGGKFPGRVHDWYTWETSDWVFLNPNFVSARCPVLGKFIRPLDNRSLPTEGQLTQVAMSSRGERLKLWGFVPRFTQQPSNLEECVGFGFDAAKGWLTFSGKPVALLADQQPALLK